MNQKIEQKYAYISDNIIKALAFAARAHRDQLRKDNEKTPYIIHPAGVGMILMQAGCPEEVVVAGILHDVIEDTKFGYEDIGKEFGKEVADLVQWVTIPSDKKGREGKEAYLKNLEQSPAEARMISAADMLYNRADIIMAVNKDQNAVEKFHLQSYVAEDLNQKRINIIEDALGGDHQLVKDLKLQNELFINNLS